VLTAAHCSGSIYKIFIRHKAADRKYIMREKIKEKKNDRLEHTT